MASILFFFLFFLFKNNLTSAKITLSFFRDARLFGASPPQIPHLGIQITSSLWVFGRTVILATSAFDRPACRRSPDPKPWPAPRFPSDLPHYRIFQASPWCHHRISKAAHSSNNSAHSRIPCIPGYGFLKIKGGADGEPTQENLSYHT